MQNNTARVVIDTNLWVSFLIGRQSSKLNALFLSKRVVLIFSNELLSEILSVVQRPKFEKYFSQTDIADLLDMIDEHAEFVKVKTIITRCRAPKDNFLLALAADGKADYLITGDDDLLELRIQGQTQIIKIADFYIQIA